MAMAIPFLPFLNTNAREPALPFGRNSEVVTGHKGRWNVAKDVLGSGSFAVVREAVNLDSGVRAVVKICSTTPAESRSNHVLYAWRELATLAHLSQVQHPNVVKLLDAAVVGETVYIFEERVAGVELFEFLKLNGGRLPTSQVRHITSQLLSALSHLHTNHVLHRDIKLDNVIVDPTSLRITLIDFNLATFYHPEAFLTEPVGCINYSSPQVLEAARGHAYVAEHGWSDLWALGVAVYGMLVGFFPFRSEDARRLNREHNALKTNPLTWYTSDIDPLAKSFVEAILTPLSRGTISAASLSSHPFVAGHASLVATAAAAQVHPRDAAVVGDSGLVSEDLDIQLFAVRKFVVQLVHDALFSSREPESPSSDTTATADADENHLRVPSTTSSRTSSDSTVCSRSSMSGRSVRGSSESIRTVSSIGKPHAGAGVKESKRWKVFEGVSGELGKMGSGMFRWKKV
ncbi:kinase-like protein [Gonapodya prolifera JEL478]|uniref:Kinase-like protein n=1 Tax=Gonapodya prolifera (strain JEL478) TaxID=1344416 RepID=A0A139ADH7_GONPJ|nr:kinase-like protein [Gonapodya prolifera JEL478]|eukprot:KXS14473.1 kinase-like protein [Gonapodya prolifera JEL478]